MYFMVSFNNYNLYLLMLNILKNNKEVRFLNLNKYTIITCILIKTYKITKSSNVFNLL